MSATSELLTDAKALIAKNQDGRKHVGLAADSDGNAVDVTAEEASSFSVFGALQRAAHDRRDSTGLDAALVLLGADGLTDPLLTGWTGGSLSNEEIAKRFDKAIARAEGGPVVEDTQEEDPPVNNVDRNEDDEEK